MPLSSRSAWFVLVGVVFAGTVAVQSRRGEESARAQSPPRSGRALTAEDYYSVQSVGGVQLSPDAHWVAFTVSTRIETDNGTRTEAYLVPADAAAAPRRVQHDGKDVTGVGWTPEGRLRYTV